MHIARYTPSMQPQWDDFVDLSRNATFIFKRGFMDYHADRFPDHSLMLYDDHDRLIALLPATASGSCVSSHAGLTYGGWVLGRVKPDVLRFLDGWELMREYYRRQGFDTLLYKPVPHIYHSYPAEEDLYALYRSGAVVDSVLASSVIRLGDMLPFNTGAKRHVKRAMLSGLSVSQSDDYATFWDMLGRRLAERYDAKPVHSLAEIELLHSRYPENIHLWLAHDELGKPIAGTVLFICGRVIKAQYIASSSEGRDINAVDFLFDRLVEFASRHGYDCLDLGPSCEDEGRRLNTGLVTQKSGYGARIVAYSSYRVSL